MSGGGTKWNVSKEELDELLLKYHCVKGRGGGIDDTAWHGETDKSASAEEFRGYVDAAIYEGSWHSIVCHGAGPKAEWLPTDAEPFIALLDYLVEKKDEVWVGTNTQVHKYDKERSTSKLTIMEASESHIRLNLTSDQDPQLYDCPLALSTKVPSDWSSCVINQRRSRKTFPVFLGTVQYEALPDGGEIIIAQGGE